MFFGPGHLFLIRKTTAFLPALIGRHATAGAIRTGKWPGRIFGVAAARELGWSGQAEWERQHQSHQRKQDRQANQPAASRSSNDANPMEHDCFLPAGKDWEAHRFALHGIMLAAQVSFHVGERCLRSEFPVSGSLWRWAENIIGNHVSRICLFQKRQYGGMHQSSQVLFAGNGRFIALNRQSNLLSDCFWTAFAESPREPSAL